MLRTSLLFVVAALAALFYADLEISTLDPWYELGRMAKGAIAPDFTVVYEIKVALLNTVVMALCGIFLAGVLGTILAFFFHRTSIRLFCAFLRSIHELFWAFMLIPLIGLNALCGVLAIAIPYAGILGKVYAEILQEADHRPLQGLPSGTGGLNRFFYGVLPVIYEDLKNYTAYRFECALRSSAIMGFIGLPTLGFHLETAFREGLYSEAAALLYCFYLLIASLPYWLKPRWVPYYGVFSFVLLSKTISFSWENVIRFFTYEILPWPMRKAGVLDGTRSVSFAWEPVLEWMTAIWQTEAWRGLWNTLILTQIALVGTALVALPIFPAICRHFSKNQWLRQVFHFLLIVMRTTPEYMLAYLLIQLWGPSMLPAIGAIALHNGAILAHLSGNNANLIQLRMDASLGKLNRYFFEVLPRVYGQFLAFLFLRWETMLRESAILGLLGVSTLGFYIDSSMSADHLDKVIFLILLMALLNMGVDTISQFLRKRMKISTKFVTSY